MDFSVKKMLGSSSFHVIIMLDTMIKNHQKQKNSIFFHQIDPKIELLDTISFPMKYNMPMFGEKTNLTKILGPKIRHYGFWHKKSLSPVNSAWCPF